MSVMHKLTCAALGVPQKLIRIVENVKNNTMLTVIPECYTLDMGHWEPSTLKFDGGFHQVSYSGKGKNRRIFDPLVKFPKFYHADPNNPDNFYFAAGCS